MFHCTRPQTYRKCKSFHNQNLDFQKFPQKCVTRNVQHFGKNCMIWYIIGKNTRYQADFYLYETSSEVFPQSPYKKWSFIEFKLIISRNSTVFQPLSFRNLKIFPRPMVAWSCLFACLLGLQYIV
jgi:hypothetical protein